jgi:uncharacterized protein YceK
MHRMARRLMMFAKSRPRASRSPMRRIIVTVPLVAATLLMGGCGTSDHTSSSTTTSTTAAHTAAASDSITKAQASAYARAVNLVASDMPGAEIIKPEKERGAPSQASVQVASCAGGVSPTRRVANIKSATFKLGRAGALAQVKSSVEAFPTAALATQNYTALRSARGRACIARLFPQLLEGKTTASVRVGPITTSFLPSPLPVGQESFGVRVVSTFTGSSLTGGEVRIPVYVDVYAILAGPAEINFSDSAVAHPVAPSTERRLLSLLYSRAQEHKL